MKNKILFVVCLLFGLLLINGGLNKFLNYMPVPADMPAEMMKDFQALTEISWLLPLIAVAEIVGGILIILPQTRALGAIIVFPVYVGILLTHVLVEPSAMPIAIVMGVILFWIIYENRAKYLPMIRS